MSDREELGVVFPYAGTTTDEMPTRLFSVKALRLLDGKSA